MCCPNTCRRLCSLAPRATPKQQAKGVPPCTCPDPDEKARIVRELDDKKAVREENKRKRDQAQGLDSASAGSSVNFSQPTGFPPLAAHGVGIGEGAFPGGARVGEPGAFGVNGDGGTSGRGPAPGGKMVGGGGGAGAKAHGLQSERQASFDGTRFVGATCTCPCPLARYLSSSCSFMVQIPQQQSARVSAPFPALCSFCSPFLYRALPCSISLSVLAPFPCSFCFICCSFSHGYGSFCCSGMVQIPQGR